MTCLYVLFAYHNNDVAINPENPPERKGRGSDESRQCCKGTGDPPIASVPGNAADETCRWMRAACLVQRNKAIDEINEDVHQLKVDVAKLKQYHEDDDDDDDKGGEGKDDADGKQNNDAG